MVRSGILSIRVVVSQPTWSKHITRGAQNFPPFRTTFLFGTCFFRQRKTVESKETGAAEDGGEDGNEDEEQGVTPNGSSVGTHATDLHLGWGQSEFANASNIPEQRDQQC
jgi:hypothetical protein